MSCIYMPLYCADISQYFTGAELRGLVDCAKASAMGRQTNNGNNIEEFDEENFKVGFVSGAWQEFLVNDCFLNAYRYML